MGGWAFSYLRGTPVKGRSRPRSVLDVYADIMLETIQVPWGECCPVQLEKGSGYSVQGRRQIPEGPQPRGPGL